MTDHTSPPIHIRFMQREDVDAIIDIENRSFPNPWSIGIIRDCLRVGYPSFVLTNDSVIIGYTIFTIAVGECHLLNLCIDPSNQGQGHGKTLLNFVIDSAKKCQVEKILLEVRHSNQAAAKLYESFGFTKLGIRRNYYKTPAGPEDAVVYELKFMGQ